MSEEAGGAISQRNSVKDVKVSINFNGMQIDICCMGFLGYADDGKMADGILLITLPHFLSSAANRFRWASQTGNIFQTSCRKIASNTECYNIYVFR